ncbi:MAG TPA: hypothetical protein VMH04_01355 [Candidatus Solibacter sp.]|nr:hypothetical protein [Candidatus Solibacter sp.]
MCRPSLRILFLILSAVGLAQKPQPPSSDELAAIAARGRLLYEYDRAAWHSTDAVKEIGVAQGAIDRYVARKTASGWVVMWGRFTQSQDKFLIVYEATESDRPEVFKVKKHDPPLEDTGFYLNAARAIATARQDFHGEQRPYNFAVLPADNERFYVYVLPAQTDEGVYPVGGDIRYLVSADGRKIIGKRRMHQDILDFAIRKDSTYSLHTHILSDLPEDSDVFVVLTRQPLIPEYIFTCNYTFKANTEASIQLVEAKTCGDVCVGYVAKLSSFQAFRKAGCPDMAGNP